MTPTEKDAMALAVLDETIRRTEAQMPTPSNRRGESTMHPCHFVEYLHDIKQARAHLASRIAELEAEVEAAESARTRWVRLHEEAFTRATRAEAELAAVREDAERYRWLKERVATYDGLSLTVAKATGWSLEPWSGDNLDAAINAARGGE